MGVYAQKNFVMLTEHVIHTAVLRKEMIHIGQDRRFRSLDIVVSWAVSLKASIMSKWRGATSSKLAVLSPIEYFLWKFSRVPESVETVLEIKI